MEFEQPDLNQKDILNEIRSRGSNTPVIDTIGEYYLLGSPSGETANAEQYYKGLIASHTFPGPVEENLEEAKSEVNRASVVDESAFNAALAEVAALEFHDSKEYDLMGKFFGRAYAPIIEEETGAHGADPERAGIHRKWGLIFHDVIEDGFSAVYEEGDENIPIDLLLEKYEPKDLPERFKRLDKLETQYLDAEGRKEDVLNYIINKKLEKNTKLENPLWEEVYHSFELHAEALGLDEPISTEDAISELDWLDNLDYNIDWLQNDEEGLLDRDDSLNKHGFYYTMFFALHTQHHESNVDLNLETKNLYREYAAKAQGMLFSHLAGLRLDSDRGEKWGKSFLKAIKNHDRHNAEAQSQNVELMKEVYEEIIEEKLDSLSLFNSIKASSGA